MVKRKVSLIVPAFNEEKFLAGCLHSLVKQTFTDIELIVVNNASTDGTYHVAERYADVVLFEPRRGYHYAVNRGVQAASGEIISVCDADSRYPPRWMKQIVEHFEQESEIVAVYGTGRFYDHSRLNNLTFQLGFPMFQRISKALGCDYTAGFNFAMRRFAYMQVGGYDPNIYNDISLDVELGRRLRRVGKLHFDPRIIVSTSARRLHDEGLFRAGSEMLESWLRFNLNKRQRVSYEKYNHRLGD